MKTICVMRDVFKAMARFEDAFEKVYQVSLNEAMILCALQEASPNNMTATSLSKRTELTPSHASKMLRILEEKELIVRTLGEEDRRLMLPEDMRKMKFDKTLSNKIVRFLKKNDPKMIFIYGQNDPWTAAGVTWLKNKKNIHVFVEPGGSHLARIGTMSEDQKQKVMSLLRGWLEE